MTYRSRMTGATVPALPADAVNGEFVVLRPADVNGTRLERGDVLLADLKGRLSLSEATFDWTRHAPTDDELIGLRTMASASQALAGHPLDEWLATVPLSPDLDDRAQLLPLERLLIDAAPHLQDICVAPRTSLHAQDVVMPVARVRRSSRHVLTHLAAHPEHWIQPTAHGVRPSRLLASVRHETLDIYENRVTAALLGRLSRHLQTRLLTLQRLRTKFVPLSDFSAVARQGTYARQQRLYRLWSEAFPKGSNGAGLNEPGTFVQRIDDVINVLRKLKGTLDRCRNSALYTDLHRHHVAGHVQITNVFRNERRYRHVALLWHAAEASLRPSVGGQAGAHELQTIAHGFAAYCALLVTRALAQLGYTPADDTPWGSRSSMTWHADSDELTLTWDEDDVFQLTAEGAALRIVPVLSRQVPAASQRPLHEPVLAIVFDPDEAVVTRPPLPHDAPGIASVGVSPDDLRSLERVARALAPVTRGRVLSRYPIAVQRLSDTAPAGIRTDGQRWLLDRLPRRSDVNPLIQRVRVQARPGLDPGKSKAERQNSERLLQLVDQFEVALGQLETLYTCPLCRSGAAIFEARSNDAYAAQCTSCHAQWGLRHCAQCSTRSPYLLPKLENWPSEQETNLHWADEVLGMDILSLPRWGSKGRQYICHVCAGSQENIQHLTS